MTIGEPLRAMRRWRSIIVASVLIGVVVGWVSASGRRATTTTFRAKHTLLVDPAATGVRGIHRAIVVATRGAVPDRVAMRLGVDRSLVQSLMYAETPRVGVVVVTGRSTDRAQAEALANVTAEELIVEFGGPKGPLRTLEPAVASPIPTDEILGAGSHWSRALLLGALGLLSGVGAAFALERLDFRIRSKRRAEQALGVPVVAEVPPVPSSAASQLLIGAQPSSFVEAYRGLRTMVDRWTPRTDNGHGPRVIVVTSAASNEGKTTTVAHLAAALAEMGRSVLVISADFRRPSLHLFFDQPRDPGLLDVLRHAPDGPVLADLVLSTGIRGIRFVSSGAPVENPAPLLERAGEVLREARTLGDFVLVDTPPILGTSDAAELARHADGVLLVVRAGRTSVGAGARSAELLRRLDIPVLGSVLVASDAPPVRDGHPGVS